MNKCIPLIAMIFFMFIGLTGFTIYHELTHGTIFESYGSKVHYGFTGFAAVTYGTCNGNPACVSEQNWTDIIGYHISGIFCMAFGLMVIWWVMNNY